MASVATPVVLVLAFLASPRPAPAPPPPSRLDKMGRIVSLEDRRTAGGDQLATLLKDDDRGLRRRAALAGGRIRDPAIVPALLELLEAGGAEVRQMAAVQL